VFQSTGNGKKKKKKKKKTKNVIPVTGRGSL
jgi:hypothetical protein